MRTKYKFYENLFDIFWVDLSGYDHVVYKYAKRYNLNPCLLKSIIVLEQINRGSLIYKILERFIVVLSPLLVWRLNLSIGVCQIKISTAKSVCANIQDVLLIKFLMDCNINIHICARIISSINSCCIEDIVSFYLTGTLKRAFSNNIVMRYYLNLCKHGISKGF